MPTIETLALLSIARIAGSKHFDGNLSIKPGIPGQIYNPHSTAPDFADHRIRAQLLADKRIIRLAFKQFRDCFKGRLFKEAVPFQRNQKRFDFSFQTWIGAAGLIEKRSPVRNIFIQGGIEYFLEQLIALRIHRTSPFHVSAMPSPCSRHA